MNRDEAYEILKSHGTIRLSYEDGIECKEELIAIGVNLSCSIAYDNEYHLAKDLDTEVVKLRDHLDEFGIDYELD